MDSNRGRGKDENSSQEELYQCSQKHMLGTGSLSFELYDSQEFINGVLEGIEGEPSLLAGEIGDSTGYQNHPIFGADLMFQNIIPSQEGSQLFGQNAYGISIAPAVDPNGNDSFGQFGNNSFDLTTMGDEMIQLSQSNENGGIVTPSITPPLSGSENVSQEYVGNGDNPGVRLADVKVENEWEFYTQGNSHSVIPLDDEDVTLADSSQEESQGGRLPVLKPFPGKYAFQVMPGEMPGLAKKCTFCLDDGKIFCIDKQPILFGIRLDFKTAPIRKLKVHGMVYYTSNAMISTAVEQCSSCRDAEAKDRWAKNFDPMGTDVEGHVVRCENPRAEYAKKRGSHNYVSMPMEKVQPGADMVYWNYKFMCMNSCQTKKGNNCRGLTLVFYLMEDQKEVGRDVYDIKVCKCPTRDMRNEIEGNAKRRSTVGAGQTVAPRMKTPVKVEDRPSPAKLARMARELDVAEARRAAANARPGPSRLVPGPLPSTSAAGRHESKGNLETDDSEACSQEEDSQNASGSILERITDGIKLASAYKRHPKRLYSDYAKNWMRQLKYLDGSLGYYRKHILQPGDLPPAEEHDPPKGGDGGPNGGDGGDEEGSPK